MPIPVNLHANIPLNTLPVPLLISFPPVPILLQGDLTDPLYFDFISFSQYATIGREMPNGQQVFKVRCLN